MTGKFRAFTITDFECNIDFYKGLKYKYLILGGETCPSTNKSHYQGYIYFENPRSTKSVIKEFKPRHIEVARGNPTENKTYCSKESIILEVGELPKQGERKDLSSIMEDIRNGASIESIAEDSPANWVLHRKAFNEYKQMIEPKRNWVTEVIFLWGPTGTGKTRTAVDAGAILVEMDGRFINGYNGEDVVCFDDIDDTTFACRGMLLKLLDRYQFNAPIKGGYRNWKPRVIYLTSNFNPDKLFLFSDPAVKRRITKVEHMTGTEVVPEGNTITSGPF